jgi:hypothetical protein
MRFLIIILLFLSRPLIAGTVQHEHDYIFTAGPLTGTMVEVRYSYPTLPLGQPLISYSPDAPATASYLDAFSTSNAQTIFSGGATDISHPELYIDFAFDPATNSTGLMHFAIWNIGLLGIYFETDPDFQTYRCGEAVECLYRTAIIPIPPTAPLLGASLLLMAGIRHRFVKTSSRRSVTLPL